MTYMHAYEDWSDEIRLAPGSESGSYEYVAGKNRAIICEDSLARTIALMRNKSFAIMTAYVASLAKDENIMRNRKLRHILNAKKLGVHILVGHYKYHDGTNGIERSYLVAKPDGMSDDEFRDVIISCLTIEGYTQESALIRLVDTARDKYFLIDSDGQLTVIGTKLTLGKIADNYSQHVKKLDVPFVFEGAEVPSSWTSAMLRSRYNIFHDSSCEWVESESDPNLDESNLDEAEVYS